MANVVASSSTRIAKIEKTKEREGNNRNRKGLNLKQKGVDFVVHFKMEVFVFFWFIAVDYRFE